MSVEIERKLSGPITVSMVSGATATTPQIGIASWVAGMVLLPTHATRGFQGHVRWRGRSYRTGVNGRIYDDTATQVQQNVLVGSVLPVQMAIRPEAMQMNYLTLVSTSAQSFNRSLVFTFKG